MSYWDVNGGQKKRERKKGKLDEGVLACEVGWHALFVRLPGSAGAKFTQQISKEVRWLPSIRYLRV